MTSRFPVPWISPSPLASYARHGIFPQLLGRPGSAFPATVIQLAWAFHQIWKCGGRNAPRYLFSSCLIPLRLLFRYVCFFFSLDLVPFRALVPGCGGGAHVCPAIRTATSIFEPLDDWRVLVTPPSGMELPLGMGGAVPDATRSDEMNWPKLNTRLLEGR